MTTVYKLVRQFEAGWDTSESEECYGIFSTQDKAISAFNFLKENVADIRNLGNVEKDWVILPVLLDNLEVSHFNFRKF